MRLESVIMDVRYALRGIRRAPLFAGSVAATIGLGLGVLASAFTLLNAYVLKPIDLPDPRALYSLSWDTSTVRRHRFKLADFEDMRDSSPHFSGLLAGQLATAMQGGAPLTGLLVTGNYFQVLGARVAVGRTLTPADATAPGRDAVVVLSHHVWQSRYGADPSIVGKEITLGRQRFDVVGVTDGAYLPGEEGVGFWAPLTMARAFAVPDPWTDPSAASLIVIGRLREGASESQARAWFDLWLRQRFPADSELAPVAVRVESRATRLPLDGPTLTLFSIIMSAFGLVLLVACANVTNLMLARGLGRQREIAVRLSLGASRWRVVRQLVIESLVLAAPASAVGLALTIAIGRAFPALVMATFPPGIVPLESILVPLDPDIRVMALLFAAAVGSAVMVSLVPGLRVTHVNLVRAAKGDVALDARRSRLRTGLVGLQIGACALFLVGATGLLDESQRLSNRNDTLSYERVSQVRLPPHLRAAVAARLASDPSTEIVAAAWRPPFGPLTPLPVVASQTRLEQSVGIMVVSPEYFPLFEIRLVRGRPFTALEANESAPVALVSAATAQRLWPGLDPIGQTLELLPPRGRPERRPDHASVRIIGVTEDVASSALVDGTDPTLVYFATGFGAPGEVWLLVRGRADAATSKAAVTAAVNAVEPEAPFRFLPLREAVGAVTWMFQAFSAAASFLGVVGLLLAFSGTYAVVSFLVTQRTREFGIRMALGATVRQIVSGLLGDTLRTASIGLSGGLAIAFALARTFNANTGMMPALTLRPYLVGATIMLVATIVAALLPSLRTARIDPSRALRVD
ncbi:MAG TPA: ABC transporter permease [Vicinamibacterales bacterium]|nr:ABC transporter permease [Vicinamibacterales bacterium]